MIAGYQHRQHGGRNNITIPGFLMKPVRKNDDQGVIFIARSYTSSLHAGLMPVSGSTYAR